MSMRSHLATLLLDGHNRYADTNSDIRWSQYVRCGRRTVRVECTIIQKLCCINIQDRLRRMRVLKCLLDDVNTKITLLSIVKFVPCDVKKVESASETLNLVSVNGQKLQTPSHLRKLR